MAEKDVKKARSMYIYICDDVSHGMNKSRKTSYRGRDVGTERSGGVFLMAKCVAAGIGGCQRIP